MRKKLSLLILSLILAVSAIGIIPVWAEDAPELTVQDINYANIGYGDMVVVNFGSSSTINANTSGYWNQISAANLELKDKDGNAVGITYAETCGTTIALNRGQARVAAVGDIITLKAGFQIVASDNSFSYPEVIKTDISYKYAAAGSPWVVYTAPRELTVVDVNYADMWFGSCVIVNFGDSTTLPTKSGAGDYWCPISTANITMVDEDGNNVLTLAETCGTSIVINRGQARVAAVGDIITLKAGFFIDSTNSAIELSLDNEQIITEISYKYQAAGSPFIVYDPGNVPPETVDLVLVEAYYQPTAWGGPAIQYNFGTSTLGNFNIYQGFSTQYIEYKNAFGETVPLVDATYVGNGQLISRIGADMDHLVNAMIGDTVTFKQGFSLNANEVLPQDVKYVVSSITAQATQLALYTGAPQTVTITDKTVTSLPVGATLQLGTAIGPEGTYGTARFSSGNEAVATVNGSGLISAAGVGTATITAYLSDTVKDTIEITVTEPVAVTGVELVGAYDYYVVKGGTFTLPALSARLAFEDGSFGEAFALTEGANITFDAVDTSTVGKTAVPVKVIYNSVEYDSSISVVVYEYYDQEISEVAIVDWFNYAIFIQLPNTSTNLANITDNTLVSDVLDHITYTRADGTPVTINGFYILATNIAIFPSFLDENIDETNYTQYYQDGDIITLLSGMKMWKWTGKLKNTGSDNAALDIGTGMCIAEGTLPQTQQYRYNGNVWGIYVEYTDIAAANNTIELKIGESGTAGVSRVPANATTGTFTYVSSDETVVTVSDKGVLKGIKAGTAEITVTIDGGTAGLKTLNVTVNVSDYIKGLIINPDTVTLNKGSDFDMSKISATYEWASGKTGEAVNLANATVTGYDKTSAEDQLVVISVNEGGKTYTGKVTVKINTAGCAGCASSADAGSVMALIALLAGAAFITLKKKN